MRLALRNLYTISKLVETTHKGLTERPPNRSHSSGFMVLFFLPDPRVAVGWLHTVRAAVSH
jgi:hypothetical protein